ncbi:IclR family transcriptional regulator [Nocardia sp. BMG111209]|uniref:IclR family transcriptional regulator n=1 Tax=Nocardia sp. BMG111209 TaxID=1160137 RepID=UPI00036033D7|nr:helix-turn-helix domain-containing protein [Nocardia sp. BMG111209]
MARPAPASTRAAGILAFLTAHATHGYTITELCQHLGMNIASANATLAVLSEWGFVVREPVHRTYVLGPALVATGYAAAEQSPGVAAGIEQAGILADELGADVRLTAVAGRDAILLASRGPEAVTSQLGYPGDRIPLIAPIGAVFLAWSDEASVAGWLERAELSERPAAACRELLAEARERGYTVTMESMGSPAVRDALRRVRDTPADAAAEQKLTDILHDSDDLLISFDDLDESAEVVFRTVAAPIFDPLGRVLLSLSVGGPGHPVPAGQIRESGRRLVRSAAVATRKGRGRMPTADPNLPAYS